MMYIEMDNKKLQYEQWIFVQYVCIYVSSLNLV